MTDRLELTWPNKDRFLLSPRDADGKPVWVDRTHPGAVEVRGHEFTREYGEVGTNPYADNLLITGDSYDALRMLCEVPEFRRHYRGKVKLVYIDPPFNTGQTFANYDDWLDHSTWLSMMRDRLALVRDLLAPDGSLWLHLDEVESHRARLVLDEVFGAQAYVGTVLWRKKYKAGNSLGLSTVHNPIIVYGRRPGWRRNRGVTPPISQQSRYANPDADPIGPWRLTHAGVRTYLSELIERGAMPTTWWDYDAVGHTETATAELAALFGSDAFATPKPEALIQRVIDVASNPGDIVLDCFAGSGTTPAVSHKMERRWVAVELNSETVLRYVIPRADRVVRGDDSGGVTADTCWRGGGGFRTVSILDSMYDSGPGESVVLTLEPDDRIVARAVAGQLGFEVGVDPPFVGRRGRMRLAYVPGAVGPDDVVELVAVLGDGERLTVVAMAVLPGAEAALTEASPGSRVLKLPRDVLAAKRRRGDA